jgi:DNA polymerase III epsilon subunit-like protein
MLVIIDTETTGLLSDPVSRITELAAIKVGNDFSVVERWEGIVQPDSALSDREKMVVQTYSGLRLEELTGPDSQPFAVRWKQLTDFCGKLPVMSWNLKFDREICQRDLNRHRWLSVWDPTPPTLRWGGCLQWCYTMLNPTQSKALCSEGLRPIRLHDAMKHCQIPNGQSHRALQDCLDTAQVMASTLQPQIFCMTGKPT